MTKRPMMGTRVPPELKTRIENIAERDNTTTSNVILQLMCMAIDAREEWTQELPKLEMK